MAAMTRENRAEAQGLLEYIDASPSPFHACAEAAQRLKQAGFREVVESASWPRDEGAWFVVRTGALLAWINPADAKPTGGLRIVGAHTDSPNVRVKPRPNTGAAGYRQIGVEVYGGVLLNSWLNRDLGLSGRVMVRKGERVSAQLVKIDRPVLVIPQLAIHLDREVNERGLVLDKQQHLAPLWALGAVRENDLQEFLAQDLEVRPESILAWDLMCHAIEPSRFVGRDEEFLSAPRLDNLESCWCALRALLAVLQRKGPQQHTPIVCLFDHEEVGSGSHRGASSPFLKDAVERIVLARGGSRDDLHRALAASACVSADMAHAVHPNWRERHEPDHWVRLNGGPVIKINTTMRYATDAEGEALFQVACEKAGVPFQKYSHRSNLACGTTIGPITAANLGVPTVDVGNAQLSMHGARELGGAEDPAAMIRALAAFLD